LKTDEEELGIALRFEIVDTSLIDSHYYDIQT